MYFESEDQAAAFVRTSFPDQDSQKLIDSMVQWHKTETAKDASPPAWWEGLDEDDLREWAQEMIDTGGTFETPAHQ